MSKTIEETAEHIVKSIFGSERAGQEYDFVVNILQERDRIAREEAIKECEGCVPEEDDGISPDTGMPQYLDFNEGITQGWNDCREQTLQAIRQMYE